MRRATAIVGLLLSGCGTDCLEVAEARNRHPRRPPARSQPGGVSPVGMEVPLAISCIGQSNCLVTGASSLTITSRPAHANRTYAWDNTAPFEVLFEANEGTGLESPGSGIGHSLTYWEGTRTGTSTRRLFVDIAAVANRSCAQWAHGQTDHTNAVTEMAEAINSMQSVWGAGLQPIPILVWVQGENDNFANTSNASYTACMIAMQADLETELNALEGTSYDIPIFLTPIANWTHTSVGNNAASYSANISQAQYEICRDHPTDFVCSHPTYPITFQSDHHYSSAGSDQNGEQFAKAILSYLDNGGHANEWALRPDPNAISCSGTTCTVPIIGGYDSTDLAVDQTVVAKKHMGGWAIDCPTQATMPVITATAVSGRDVTLTLNRTPSADCLISYAHYGIGRNGSPATSRVGAVGGNFRSSTATNFYTSANLAYDWLIPFQENIDTCTSCGEAAETTWVRSQGSYRADNSPAGWVSCGDPGTAFNGSQHVSVYMRVRHTAWPTGLQTILAHNASNRTQWEMRSSSTLGRAMRILIATGTNDFGTYFQTAVNTFQSAGWDAVCWTYDGTQATNLLRLQTVVNGVDVTALGTYSGTIPSSMTTVVEDLSIGAGGETGTNPGEWGFNDIAIWPTTSLSLADCIDLTGATPEDPMTDISTAPTWYIPAHTNLEVQGSGTSLQCRTYGTGVTRQASSP